jgi:hypothetical protein
MANTTFKADLFGQKFATRSGNDNGVVTQYFAHVLSANTASGDKYNLCILPKNATLLRFAIQVPAMDGATALTLDVGDDVLATRYVNASTAGQAGGIIVATVVGVKDSTTANPLTGTATGLPYQYTSQQIFVLGVHTAPTTPAGSGLTIKGWVEYDMNLQRVT